MSPSAYDIVLASSPDGPIIAYDASTGATLTHFFDSRSPRRGLALAGKTFIAASHVSPTTGSGSIRLYNWWSSTAFHNLPVPEPVAPLASTSDGSYLFAGGLSGCVYPLSLPSGDVLKSFPAHRKPVSCLRISTDGSLLISGSDDGTIVVVSIFQLVGLSENGQKEEDLILHKFSAHSGAVTAIVSGARLCNSNIISCSLDGTCKFWSLLRGTHLRTVVFPCTILGIALDPTESELYAAGSDGSVYNVGISKRPASQGREVVAWEQKHRGPVVSLTTVNEGMNLISASEDGCVWVWKVDEGKVVMELGDCMANISDLVVASGVSYGTGHRGTAFNGSEDWRSTGLCGEKLVRFPVKETMEMEDVLRVGEKERSRAIDMLESAIGMYEKLLELILKEAKRGTCNSSKEKGREKL